MMDPVQSLWIGPTLPPLQQLSIRSFLANGHSYHLYAFDTVAGLPDGAMLCDAATVLPRESVFCYQNGFGKGSFSAFSNLFRYKLILTRGGWWVDTDIVCLKPFDFADPIVIATEIDDDGAVNCATCAFRCPPGAAHLQYCYDVALAKDKATLEWGQIGPQLFTTAVRQLDLHAHCVPPHTFNPVNFFEFRDLIAPGFDMSRLRTSHAVHFWNQMWKSSEIDLGIAGARDSLYARLRSRYLPAAFGGT